MYYAVSINKDFLSKAVEVALLNNTNKTGMYTLKVLCDDKKTVYVDGVKMDISGSQGWSKMATLLISPWTRVIGIKCFNVKGAHGIKVQVEDEAGNILLTSDNRWKCSKQEQISTDWTVKSFVEDQTWKPAVYTSSYPPLWSSGKDPDREDFVPISGEVIWTSKTTSVNETVYCRSQRQLPLWSGKEFTLVDCK